jgi:tight adherence protein C
MIDQADILIAAIAAIAIGVSAGLGVWIFASRRGGETEKQAPAPVAFNDSFRRMRVTMGDDGSMKEKTLSLAELIGSGLTSPSMREGLVEPYALACWPGGLSDNQVMGMSILMGLPVTLALLLTFLMTIPPLFIVAPVLGFAAGYMGMKGWISNRKYEREVALSGAMPFVMDLIMMSMKAGASFQMALEQLVSDYAGQPVGDEFGAVLADVNNGVPLAEAMGGFRQRLTRISAAVSFADDVIQSQKLGRPLAETLEHSANRFKTMRIMAAREKAGQAKVKILIPGILILFAGLMILFGPFIVKFLNQEMDVGF